MKLNWKSLKLFFAVGACLLLTAAWFVTAHWQVLSPNFTIYKDGIVAIASFYLVAHSVADVGSQFANRGQQQTSVDVQVDQTVPQQDLSKMQIKGSPKKDQ